MWFSRIPSMPDTLRSFTKAAVTRAGRHGAELSGAWDSQT